MLIIFSDYFTTKWNQIGNIEAKSNRGTKTVTLIIVNANRKCVLFGFWLLNCAFLLEWKYCGTAFYNRICDNVCIILATFLVVEYHFRSAAFALSSIFEKYKFRMHFKFVHSPAKSTEEVRSKVCDEIRTCQIHLWHFLFDIIVFCVQSSVYSTYFITSIQFIRSIS